MLQLTTKGVLLLSLILVCLTNSHEQDQLIRVESYLDLLSKVQADNRHLSSLMLITTAIDCEKCNKAMSIYEDFLLQADSVVQGYILDCRSVIDNQLELQIIPNCYQANADLLPAIVFYQPQQHPIFLPVEQAFVGPLSLASLHEAASTHLPFGSTFLEDIEDLDQLFLKDTSLATKVILLRPDDKVPLYWKAITNFYQDRIDFAEIDSDHLFLQKRYQTVPNLLQILILTYNQETQNYTNLIYNGQKRYPILKDYLKELASERQVLEKSIKAPRTIYDADSVEWHKMDEIRFEMLNSVLRADGQWILVHFSVESKQHPKLKTFRSNFKGLMKFYEINCDSTDCQEQLAQEYKVKTFPALLIYSFNQKKQNKPVVVMNSDSISLISEILIDQLQFVSSNSPLVLEECKAILDKGESPVLWFYDDDDVYWKLAAATIRQHYQKLKFVFYKDPSPEIKEQFGIEKLPYFQTFTAMNLETGEHQKYDFGGELKLELIFIYFNQVLQVKMMAKQVNKDIEETNTQDSFDQKCGELDRLCIIGLMDTMKDGRFNQDIQTLKNVLQKFIEKKISWVWIDGRCHSNLMKNLQLDEENLPYMIIYDPSNDRFLKLQTKFTEKELTKFLLFATEKKNRSKFKTLPHAIELDNKECEKIRESLKKEYQEEKQKKHKLFIQAERNRDKEREQEKRIQEQKELLEDFDDDKITETDEYDEDL